MDDELSKKVQEITKDFSAKEFMRLRDESLFFNGARQMLLRLMETFDFKYKHDNSKDSKVYVKAELDYILDSIDNTKNWLYSLRKKGRYTNRKRNKKGKLVSCDFYIEK